MSAHRPVMLQVEGRDRWLAFYVPMNEANRLARCLGMTQCPCTPIFELTEQLIGHLGATVVRAFLEGDERGIAAGLVLERGGAELLMPCHPPTRSRWRCAPAPRSWPRTAPWPTPGPPARPRRRMPRGAGWTRSAPPISWTRDARR